MKLKLIVLGLVILGASAACTRKTCHTYIKNDTNQPVSQEAAESRL